MTHYCTGTVVLPVEYLLGCIQHCDISIDINVQLYNHLTDLRKVMSGHSGPSF